MKSPKHWVIISLIFTCLCITKSLLIQIFLFYVEKCSDYTDADVSKVCCSVSPNPVRCPVKIVKDISYNDYCSCNFLHPNGRMLD